MTTGGAGDTIMQLLSHYGLPQQKEATEFLKSKTHFLLKNYFFNKNERDAWVAT